MFKFFQGTKENTPVAQFEATLARLGYQLTPYGRQVSSSRLEHAANPYELAFDFSVTTLAYELHHAGTATTALLRFRPQAVEMLEVLNRCADEGKIPVTEKAKIEQLVMQISTVNERQLALIEHLMADEELAREPLLSRHG